MAMERRADLGRPVGPWFARQKPELRAIAEKVHALVLSAAPGLKAGLKWGMPCYEKAGMVCFLMAAKAHVTFGFYQGARLEDPDGILSGSGKALRSLRLVPGGKVPAAALKRLVKAAAALNPGVCR